MLNQSWRNWGCITYRVELGETEIMEDISPDQLKHLDIALRKIGLELMDDKKSILVEKIKTIIIELVHYSDEPDQNKPFRLSERKT